jgi:hypothetical protein
MVSFTQSTVLLVAVWVAVYIVVYVYYTSLTVSERKGAQGFILNNLKIHNLDEPQAKGETTIDGGKESQGYIGGGADLFLSEVCKGTAKRSQEDPSEAHVTEGRAI